MEENLTPLIFFVQEIQLSCLSIHFSPDLTIPLSHSPINVLAIKSENDANFQHYEEMKFILKRFGGKTICKWQ